MGGVILYALVLAIGLCGGFGLGQRATVRLYQREAAEERKRGGPPVSAEEMCR